MYTETRVREVGRVGVAFDRKCKLAAMYIPVVLYVLHSCGSLDVSSPVLVSIGNVD